MWARTWAARCRHTHCRQQPRLRPESRTPEHPRRCRFLNGSGPEVVPIVTRAGAHDDFGRIVFDWPWAVAYGAQIEGKTLTVMFDRHLRTTFQEIPRNLGAYITDIELGPDGQSVVASLTDEYRLRTFILNNSENERRQGRG